MQTKERIEGLYLPLLLEIGTEELPPAFLRRGSEELAHRIREILNQHELQFSEPELFYTPRRLSVRFSSVQAEKPGGEVEVQGPPAKVAFDTGGTPTRTGIGFAAAHGKQPQDLYLKTTARGEYAFVRKEVPPLHTREILLKEIPLCLRQLSFPRTMRWQTDATRFPRPIRWLVCLLGSEVVPVEFASLTADRLTWAKRSESHPLSLADALEYENTLREHGVLCRPEERREAVRTQADKLCTQAGGFMIGDEELLEETVNITESPVVILCRFDPTYLTLPPDVLITALKKHQRCFAVQAQTQNPKADTTDLLPLFVAVADTPGCDQELVARWYEHAVESRLRDARFYFDEDLRRGLEALVEEEKRVVWIEGIGTYYDKTAHLRELCGHLAAELSMTEEEINILDRAAWLSKADLLTNMVKEKEFTSLQGKMGGIYARLLGERAEVADAIAEHYLPTGADSELPRTRYGACLSLVDRIDNIVATFLTGSIPTGSEDPFGLRRAASGLLNIILAHHLDIDLKKLLTVALRNFKSPSAEYSAKLIPFLQERLESVLADKGIPYDISAAVMETTWHYPVRALAAARALSAFRSRPEFEKLIIGQKRVANILKNQQVTGLPNPALFYEPAEIELWQTAQKVEPEVRKAMASYDYFPALELLLELRQPIDRLFDEVLVMAEDERLRTNRLRLALYLRSLFLQVADLSRIVLEGETK